METTIFKTVKGKVMEEIFNNPDAYNCNVRYYKALNLLNDDEWNENKKYKFEIIIRHPEEENAEELFEKAVMEYR